MRLVLFYFYALYFSDVEFLVIQTGIVGEFADEGSEVIQTRLGDEVAFGVDEFVGHGFGVDGDVFEGGGSGGASIDFSRFTDEGDHQACFAFGGEFDGLSATHASFIDIELDGSIGGGHGERFGDLEFATEAELLVDYLMEHHRGAGSAHGAEFDVFELITNLRGGDGRAVGIGNAFAADDGDEAVSVVAAFDIGEEFGFIEFSFGHAQNMGCVVGVLFAQGAGGGQPACFSSDALEDDELIDFFHISGEDAGLHDRQGHISSGAGEARGVVGSEEVVIDGFGDADTDDVVMVFTGVGFDAADGIHCIVSADEEDVADVVFF